MRNGWLIATACTALACGALTSSAQASSPLSKPGRSAAAAAVAFTAAAGKTRVAAVINADGSIELSKGVSSVINPTAGTYCIALSGSINPATAVPVMSFNFYSTNDYDVFVTYAPGNTSCPTNTVPVVTYASDSGTPTLTNEGFTFVVP